MYWRFYHRECWRFCPDIDPQFSKKLLLYFSKPTQESLIVGALKNVCRTYLILEIKYILYQYGVLLCVIFLLLTLTVKYWLGWWMWKHINSLYTTKTSVPGHPEPEHTMHRCLYQQTASRSRKGNDRIAESLKTKSCMLFSLQVM